MAGLLPLLTPAAGAQAQAMSSTVTIQANDLASGATLPEFQYLVNRDNSRLPTDPDPSMRTGIAPTESNTPIVAEGDQNRPTIQLPDGRYLISIRSADHKMWGRHITLPRDAGTVRIDLREASEAHPLPLGKIKVFVFNDNQWANSAPDTGEAGLRGFHVTLEEQTEAQVSVDYHNKPLCGGDCVTDADGLVQIDDLSPASYFVYVTPPEHTGCGPGGAGKWVQTSTFEGGFGVRAGVEEGSDGNGAPSEVLWEAANLRTSYWFGFVCTATDFAVPGTATISGTARNWQAWPPFEVLTMGEPVEKAYLALSDSASDNTVFVGRGDADGNFSIANVPAGTYNMSIWDEQLNYIIRFLPVTVTAGQRLDLGDVGVSRWFGWLHGHVYKDSGVAADGTVLPAGTQGNGIRDCADPATVSTCEAAIPNTDVDQRWRDGSIKDATVTDARGHYEYPQAEGGGLGKWFVGEVGFTRFGTTGAAVHDEYNPGLSTHVPTAQGGGLLTNQLVTEGHRAEVDWGKYQYGDDEPGQIVGITYFATTRNEFDARFQAHEDYEPAIPDVTVRLEGLGPDGLPNTTDDPILNEYVTDHWQPSTGCDVRDSTGVDIGGDVNPQIGAKCIEVPTTGNETKDAAFDGGYAFADYCPDGFDHFDAGGDTVCAGGAGPVPLVAGTYITHVVMPRDAADPRDCNPANPDGFKYISGPTGPAGGKGCLYRPVREEDVNVDLGAQFTPDLPPPPCTGDAHVIDQSTLTERSVYFGVNPSPSKPLCDKRLVVLQQKQNANADFFMMTNFRSGPDVAEPGRIVGLVTDDIYFDRDPQSIWYGEARPIGDIPIGVRDYAGRLLTTLTTAESGAYEAILPSTETFNCPIPQGPCPGMYVVVINDPGDKAHPNPNYKPNYLTESLAWDVWPGLTNQLDTPLDPISGTACELAVDTPELLQVSKPYISAGDSAAARLITIQGDFFGTAAGSVLLTDATPAQTRTLTVANGGIVSWADRQIAIRVPAVGGSSSQIRPGPKQLSIRTAAGASTTNGLTFHILGNTAGSEYAPPVVDVDPPTNPHAIQNAINAATPGSLLVLRPGVYRENVVLWKRLKLQGLGPGGIVGARELQQRSPDDPRFNIQGTVIDGRFFQDNKAAWQATVASLGSLAGVDASHPVLPGADITVVARKKDDYTTSSRPARIDGIGVTTGRGEGAGGIQLQAYAINLQLTNNVLESNGGVFAGGIGLGQPYADGHNTGVKILYDRIIGNGGLTRSGGIGIFRGSSNYEIANSILCANFGVEYGAGISHWGLSPGGSIHDNQVYYNASVDSGAGIAISQELPRPGPNGNTPLGDGSGAVDIERNLIQGNYSGDDGGGIFLHDAQKERVRIRNNMIVDNGSADIGGAITMDDSANVQIVNNTIANNVATASCETCDATPHSAGLAAEKNDPLFQATLPSGAPKFSNPAALFDNIFWNNEAFTLSQPGPGATLVSHGYIDFEVHGTTSAGDTFRPRYSLLTNGQILGPDGQLHALPGGQGNITGQDPQFIDPVTLELQVAGSRLDPQMAAVTIVAADPPTGVPGDYHIAAGSPAVNRGPTYSNFPSSTNSSTVFAPTVDFDGQPRSQSRQNTPLDLGADELPSQGTQGETP
ncbi:right-handed parallel beta-helix repeat-containing protein [Catellatospora tritici]|uniref:right-handed parallel beta-helix repeat-containing protein n=1 Tax=Catellatospora tritici TaxID=2851566 RepID=UPI001C2D8B9E|nr:right-handed parallel beta-helix repeat-containing protein [Catellatospora tritici]MBV1853885.1 right-handed parallel beta-helix repeat-containing protein [Catellatospora tritici]